MGTAACTRPCEVVITVWGGSTGHLLLQLVRVEVFEEVALLTLVITHVKGVACHVLLLSVKVFDHGKGIIVGALLHLVHVTRLLYSSCEAALVLDLPRRVVLRLLNHPVGICFYNLLTRSRLARHCLASLACARILSAVALGCILIILAWSHSVGNSEHVSGVVKIVRSEGKAVQVPLVLSGWSNVGVCCPRIARI